jgi:tRNA-5-methyluridine54 2-sulfurtransferase
MVKELSDTKYVFYIEKKIRDTIRKYKLFTKNDKLVVAVSGGKDSTVCLYILKKLGYDVEAITIDARIGSYTEENIKNLKIVCNDNKIKLHIVDFRKEFGMSLCYIRDVLKSKGHSYSSCMLCGILKRYLLNKYARKLGFDALATGHNLDDEAQAFVMNVFRNDIKLASRQGPTTGSKNFEGFVKRVKPLYLINENEVIRYSKIKNFPVYYGICPCSVGAFRRNYLNMLNDFEKKNPSLKYNIIRFQESIMNFVDKEKLNKGTASRCKCCGEPASSEICNTCKIFKELKILK